MSIKNSYFNSNKATDGRGGVIYTDSKSTSLTISNNVFLLQYSKVKNYKYFLPFAFLFILKL